MELGDHSGDEASDFDSEEEVDDFGNGEAFSVKTKRKTESEQEPLTRGFTVKKPSDVMREVTAASVAINSHSALLATRKLDNSLMLDTVDLNSLKRDVTDVVRVIYILFVGMADRASIQTLKEVISEKKKANKQIIEEIPANTTIEEMSIFNIDQELKKQTRTQDLDNIEKLADANKKIENAINKHLTTSEEILNEISLTKLSGLQNTSSSPEEFEDKINIIQKKAVLNYAKAILPNLQEMIRLAKNTMLELVLELKVILDPARNKKYTANDIIQVSDELKLAMMELRDAIHTLFDMLIPENTQKYLQIYSITSNDPNPLLINTLAISDSTTTLTDWNVEVDINSKVFTKKITPENTEEIERAKSLVNGKVIFSPVLSVKKGSSVKKDPPPIDPRLIHGLQEKIQTLPAFSNLKGITSNNIIEYLFYLGFKLVVISNVACNHVVEKSGDIYTHYVSNNADTLPVREEFDQFNANNKILMTIDQAQEINHEVSSLIRSNPGYKDLYALLVESVTLFTIYEQISRQPKSMDTIFPTEIKTAEKKREAINNLFTGTGSIFHFDNAVALPIISQLITGTIPSPLPIEEIKRQFIVNNFSSATLGGSRRKRSRRRKNGSKKSMKRKKTRASKSQKKDRRLRRRRITRKRIGKFL